MELVYFLQVASSFMLFSNKYFVLMGKKTGWGIGMVGCILAVFYFFLVGLYVYTINIIGVLILMGYGLLAKERRDQRVENLIRIVIVLVMSALTYFVFDGALTIYEFVSAVGILLGTYFLTHAKVKIGWFVYCIAHIIACYVGVRKGQNIFAFFQLASTLVSIVGINKK